MALRAEDDGVKTRQHPQGMALTPHIVLGCAQHAVDGGMFRAHDTSSARPCAPVSASCRDGDSRVRCSKPGNSPPSGSRDGPFREWRPYSPDLGVLQDASGHTGQAPCCARFPNRCAARPDSRLADRNRLKRFRRRNYGTNPPASRLRACERTAIIAGLSRLRFRSSRGFTSAGRPAARPGPPLDRGRAETAASPRTRYGAAHPA